LSAALSGARDAAGRLGGWVECVEQGEVLYQAGPAYQKLARWAAAFCRYRGLDPDLGPKLKALLRLAGVHQVTEPIGEAGITTAEQYDRTIAAACAEFAAERYANSDVLYVAYGRR
jgi:hypothetical protein